MSVGASVGEKLPKSPHLSHLGAQHGGAGVDHKHDVLGHHREVFGRKIVDKVAVLNLPMRRSERERALKTGAKKKKKKPYLHVSDSRVPLEVVADHKISQDAVGGDHGLLHDVGAEGDLAGVLFPLDRRGDWRLHLGWSTKTPSVFRGFTCHLKL